MASDDPMADSFLLVHEMLVGHDAAGVADAKRVVDALANSAPSPTRSSPPLLGGPRHVRRPVRHPLDGRRPELRECLTD
jgi:hypothetical protein